MASVIEYGWRYLITHFSDFQLACLGSFLLHESVFFFSGLPFIFLERAGLLSKYKIQTKNNSPAAQEKCITRLLLYHFCVNLPVMIASYPVFRYMGMRSSFPLPSWKVVSTQIIFYFILEDFVFYWGHRVLHTKWLYKHVHSVHHEYATPFGLTSEQLRHIVATISHGASQISFFSMEVLIFMTTIIVCFIPNLATTHLHLYTWTGYLVRMRVTEN
ncbi:hypothetical protein SLEP1_g41519 [Rubroshorea leprosula]|uniref:Fatty acid hydroxylase domain-containing protein n=1 Tax=Rubroshorea leprosula TaxID=152421 RepID=A0AAV5L6W5_9ROSI|nr:hypothetical protein SLEP1_g41519 [Rubroshorea leprosula]